MSEDSGAGGERERGTTGNRFPLLLFSPLTEPFCQSCVSGKQDQPLIPDVQSRHDPHVKDHRISESDG